MKKEKVLAIDIGASKIRIQSVDQDKNLSDEHSVSIVGLNLNNDSFLSLLSDLIVSVISSEKDTNFIAISIGSPGPLNPKTGAIIDPPNMQGIRNFPITDELNKKFNLPVYLLNDADVALLGEVSLRADQGLRNAVYLTLSSGVGSGILQNGKLAEEKFELGHQPIMVKDDERLCTCGELNHAEAYLGTKGLAMTYSKIFKINEEIKPEEQHLISPMMREGVSKNDTRWEKLEEAYAKHLAILLSKTFTDFKPELIILGGGIIFQNEPLLIKTQKELASLSPSKHLKIELAKSRNPGILGSAQYAFEKLKGV